MDSLIDLYLLRLFIWPRGETMSRVKMRDIGRFLIVSGDLSSHIRQWPTERSWRKIG
jgi:hypothetical protein